MALKLPLIAIFLFTPQMSLEDTLDLGYFACSTVNLSIAVVNQYGNSNFSPSTEINVYGGKSVIENTAMRFILLINYTYTYLHEFNFSYI